MKKEERIKMVSRGRNERDALEIGLALWGCSEDLALGIGRHLVMFSWLKLKQ